MGCTYQCLAAISCLGVGGLLPTELLFWSTWLIFVSFYVSHWEKYNTGMMFLPWAYDFSQLLLAFTYLVTGFQGIVFWRQQVTIPFLNITEPMCNLFFYTQILTGLGGLVTS